MLGSLRLPFSLQQQRGLLGAAKAAVNQQIHNINPTLVPYPQPSYDWMVGRYVLDRNGTIWHKQTGYRHKRYNKSASHLTRLKRWKPLFATYAAKFKKLGFKRKYWQDPDPNDVPGFQEGPRPALKKWSGIEDRRRWLGDPALRPN
ncbi:MAG: hypothetical protein WDW38_003479 [Sanguina aurantia]